MTHNTLPMSTTTTHHKIHCHHSSLLAVGYSMGDTKSCLQRSLSFPSCISNTQMTLWLLQSDQLGTVCTSPVLQLSGTQDNMGVALLTQEDSGVLQDKCCIPVMVSRCCICLLDMGCRWGLSGWQMCLLDMASV